MSYFLRAILAAGLLSCFFSREIFLASFLTVTIALILTGMFFLEEYISYKKGNETNLINIIKNVPVAVKNVVVVKFLWVFQICLILWLFFSVTVNNAYYFLHLVSKPQPVVKEYTVKLYLDRYSKPRKFPYFIKILNNDDYTSRNATIGISGRHYLQFGGAKFAKVEIEGKQSIFGISFPKDFEFKSIKALSEVK